MKSIFKIAVLSLCVLTAVSFAYAGGGRGLGRGVRDGSGPINRADTVRPNYVDRNGDGICDNSGATIAGPAYGRGMGYGAGNGGRGIDKGIKVRGLGRGVRDGSGPINRTVNARSNYVNTNGDGICDNSGVRIPTK